MKITKYSLFILLTFITISLCLTGCGIYSFSGSTLPPHIKSVAVPLFENKTAEFGIDQELTDALIDALIDDNALKVVDYRDADSVLKGQIIRVTDRAGQYSQTGNNVEEAGDYRVTIAVKVAFEDRQKRTVLWEESISQWGVYDLVDISREDGMTEAIDKITTDIITKTVSGW